MWRLPPMTPGFMKTPFRIEAVLPPARGQFDRLWIRHRFILKQFFQQWTYFFSAVNTFLLQGGKNAVLSELQGTDPRKESPLSPLSEGTDGYGRRNGWSFRDAPQSQSEFQAHGPGSDFFMHQPGNSFGRLWNHQGIHRRLDLRVHAGYPPCMGGLSDCRLLPQ